MHEGDQSHNNPQTSDPSTVDIGLSEFEDTFPYASLPDQNKAQELQELSVEIRSNEKKIIAAVCDSGRRYARARELLGEGETFVGWCKKSTARSKSSVYGHIAIYEAYGLICPTVGRLNVKTLSALAGPQYNELRPKILGRLREGESISDPQVVSEMTAFREERIQNKSAAEQARKNGSNQAPLRPQWPETLMTFKLLA